MNRNIYYPPLKLSQAAAYLSHIPRTVFPDVKRVLHEASLFEDALTIYGNTGRKNQRAYKQLTYKQLEVGKVRDYFEDVFFRPKDAKDGVMGKIEAIQRMLKRHEEVIHFDDNPVDALRIARYFRKRNLAVQVVVVQDLSAGILFDRVEHEEDPNVHRVATFREGVYATLHQ